jgi:hypothetical protein
MIRTDLDTVKQWSTIQLDQLPQTLKSQGFQFVPKFSTDDHRIFVSQDGQYMMNIAQSTGKVYSTKNQKAPLHTFGVRKGDIPPSADKAFRTH